MPKVNRRPRHRAASSASSTTSNNNAATERGASNDVPYKKISVDQDNVSVLYEHIKSADGQTSSIRLHISKRGALGPPPPPPRTTTTAQNNEHNIQRVTTVVINDDRAGLTVDVASTKSDNDAFNIIITNNCN
ncbi:unnamed protein product [Adineta ricciae]|uniref:Uncharacterized protein n=1 Tax=Adineta ricciae TaxID=249248 RepID=A0A815U507_ADIRI|nr:unnamed protein product [Adineta ricciae]CAF1672790.1 unnamed protein product [Adineta ricciae]